MHVWSKQLCLGQQMYVKSYCKVAAKTTKTLNRCT